MSKKTNAPRKSKKTVWITVLVIVVAALAAVSYFTSQGFQRTKNVGTIGSDKISEAEFAYFYQTTYQDYYANLYNTYGEAVQYFIDTSKPLDQQNYSSDMTIHDYVTQTTCVGLKEIHTICQAAEKAGYTISESGKINVENAVKSLDTSAEQAGYTVSMYLRALYGHGMNKAIYKDCIEKIVLADEYAGTIAESFTYTDEDIDAYYQANKVDYDTIDLRMVSIPGIENEDGTIDLTEAEAKAKEALETCKDEEALSQFAVDLSDEDEVAEADDTLYTYVPSSQLQIEGMTEWFYDEARQYGDMEIFAGENAYYVAFYIDRHDIDYSTVNMRHILAIPSETDENGVYTEESTEAALNAINEYYEEWEASDMTEETFATMANVYSQDPGSNQNGGLYSDVYKGQMNKIVNDWIFDESRKDGDTAILQSANGFHILYFAGETGNNYKTVSVSNAMRQADYSSWYSEAEAGISGEISFDAGSIMLG